MEKVKVGQSVRRKEDIRLITGKSQYTADLSLPNQYYAYFLRSPYPHAEIRSIDTKTAEGAPGIKAVYTGKQILEAGLGPLPCLLTLPNANGEPMHVSTRYALAVDCVKFVGDPVVVVIAESPADAVEASDLIEIDYKELPFNVKTEVAADPNTPQIWEDCENNTAVNFQAGDSDAVKAAMEQADTIVEVNLINNRLIPGAMEPRSCLADYNAEKDLHILYAPSQGPMILKSALASSVFNKPMENFQVISKATGGAFGARAELYPEACLCLWAAMKLGHPVKWTGTKSESLLTDVHGRDNVTHATLALDSNGKALGLKVNTTANMGGYLSALGPFVPTLGGGKITGTMYNIPAIHLTVNCVYTNTSPTSAYRGAGRPEAAYIIERLLETAASKMGIGSDEIRYINFIKVEELPFTNFYKLVIKSGDFATTQKMALEKANWSHFEERRQQSIKSGKLRGIGIGNFVETSGGGPKETAQIRFEPDGSVSVIMGTYSHGQGHETSFSQIIAEQLGVPFDNINLVQGDSGIKSQGGDGPLAGITGGSRTSQMGGVAVLRASKALINKGKLLAAHMMKSEAVEFKNGIFESKDSPNNISLTIQEVAHATFNSETLPPGVEPGLNEIYEYNREPGFTFPNGCHVCEVEIDPETGNVEIIKYTAVDDCGKLINPMIVHGQSHGAITQGVGQALLEHTVYDPQSGQLLSGSLMDYCMPRAHHVPHYDLGFNEVPDPDNDLGVKGAGEGGSCGAPPAIVHAVLNALKDHGVTHLDMPLTSERVWQSIHN